MALSNLEIHWLVKEFQCLVGEHFNKISDLENGWKLKIGKRDLIAIPPERIHLTTRAYAAIAPRGFSQYCRAHLHGRVTQVWQPNFDRVIAIDLDGGQQLVFEMFADGNAIIVSDGKTEKAFREEDWKDRSIRRGKPYSFPASGKLDPRELSESQYSALFKGKDLIHSLLEGLNLSGEYLELACERADVAKTKKEPVPAVYKEIKRMLEEYEPGLQPGPVCQRFPTGEFVPKPSLSEALDTANEVQLKATNKSEKVKRMISQQETAITELEARADEAKAKGDAVYEHWTRLEKIVKTIELCREQAMTFDQINEKMAGKASINKKTKELTLKV